MTDFAANIHFRTFASSGARKDGFVGGYGWFLGRYSSWPEFQSNLVMHLSGLGYHYHECEQLIEINSLSDLSSDEQRDLFIKLDEYPIQYSSVHMYKNDDA